MTIKVVAETYNEALQRYADEYYSETNKDEATAREIAVWLIRTGRWEPPSDLMVRQCRQDVARALREQHITDERGRSIRAKHVMRVKRGDRQQYFWADIRKTSRVFMEAALQQRREQIVGDCRQLKLDAEYYNEKNPSEAPIQMMFDFRDDLADEEFSGEYPPRKPR